MAPIIFFKRLLYFALPLFVLGTEGNIDSQNEPKTSGLFSSPSISTTPACTAYRVSALTLYFEECFMDNAQAYTATLNGVEFKETKVIPGGVLIVLAEDPKIEEGNSAQLVIQEKQKTAHSRAESVTYADIPKERILPEFSRLAHDLRSGNITILNEKSFYVPNLYYDGLGPDAFFWVGNGTSGPDEHGRKVANEHNSFDVIKKYTGESIVITLPPDLTVNDIDYFGVWCITYSHNFGYVDIPKNLKISTQYARENSFKLDSQSEGTIEAQHLISKEIQHLPESLLSVKKSCTVYQLSKMVVYLEECIKSDTLPYLATLNGAVVQDTKFIPGGVVAVMADEPKIEKGENAQLIIKEKRGKTAHAESVTYADIPKERILPEFSRLAHDLRSGNITILNEKSFYVPNLYYDGLGPDAFFWVGNGTSGPDEHGRKVANEHNSFDVLKKYTGESIVITLPPDLTVNDIDYFGVWCITYSHNFGYVDIPKNFKFK